MGAYKRPGMKTKWKVLTLSEDFHPLDLSSLRKRDVVEVRIAPLVLLRSGYSFIRKPNGKVFMIGNGIRATEMVFGIYNLWFLIHWIEWSTGMDISQMEFCRLDKELGGQYVANTVEEGVGSVFRPARLGHYWPFRSEAKGRALFAQPIMPVHRLAPNCDFDRDDMPRRPGYWKRIMDPDHTEELQAWCHAIEQERMGYTISPNKTELYFSNALSVLKGYPPNAALLGFPKLDIDDTGRLSDPGLQIDQEDRPQEHELCAPVSPHVEIDEVSDEEQDCTRGVSFCYGRDKYGLQFRFFEVKPWTEAARSAAAVKEAARQDEYNSQ